MLPGVRPALAGLIPGVIEVTVSSGGGGLTLSSLFLSGDWTGPLTKRVIIPSGVTRGSSAVGTPAIRTGTGRGGKLEIVLNGELQGAGGAANSGVGGDSLLVEQSGTTLLGTGANRAGGGGGGKAGDGGPGTYTAQEGPFYHRHDAGSGVTPIDAPPYYFWESGASHGYWNSSGAVTFTAATSWYDGSVYTYYRGAFAETFGGSNYYIYRQWTAASSGGAGGNGGRGRGYDGAPAAGVSGVAGGTNAGTGGTGGTGAEWGATGSTGATGGSGNAGGGVTGTAGGLAGYAINGLANLTNLFTGTAQGRTV